MSKWVVFFAFFGGDIKARVEFQGENDECWNMCDVLIPLHSSAWRLRRYQRVVDWNPCVEWKDVDLVIPGLPQSHNKQSNIEVRLIRTARAPAT
ncbi:MAG: hypothetical protein O7D91_01935 [Planctomycetota bacterium]|nr:hypothetical protein [Planctomycetota bacterium]